MVSWSLRLSSLRGSRRLSDELAGVQANPMWIHPNNRRRLLVWTPELLPRQPDLNMGRVEHYLLYSVRPAFVYSVSPDFVRSCQTPILVLPDKTSAHPLVSSGDVASFCPNAEIRSSVA